MGPRFTPPGAPGGGAATGDDPSLGFASVTDAGSISGERDVERGGAGARDGGAGGFGRRDGGAGATTGGTGLKPGASGARLRDGTGGGPLGRGRGGGGALRGPELESVSERAAREGEGGWDGGTDERPDGRGGDGFLGELSSSAMTYMELTP